MVQDIHELIAKADIDLYDGLRATANYDEVADAIKAGNFSKERVYDLNNEFPGKGKTVAKVLMDKYDALNELEETLATFDGPERTLMAGKVNEIAAKLHTIGTAGKDEAYEKAHAVFGFPVNDQVWFNNLLGSLTQVIADYQEKTVATPIAAKSIMIDKQLFADYLKRLAHEVFAVDLTDKLAVVNARNCSFDRPQGLLKIPDGSNDYYTNGTHSLFTLALITGPHELGHLISGINGSKHPSSIVSSIYSKGAEGYAVGEEGREKWRQMERIRLLASIAPDLLTPEQANQYLFDQELAASQGHFLAYAMRNDGLSDKDIFGELRRFLTEPKAAMTLTRSALGMPEGKGFPGYLVYWAGAGTYRDFERDHPEKALLMQNGAMPISHVLTDSKDGSLYELLVDLKLANKKPAIAYDAEKIVHFAADFIAKSMQQ